jgi:nitrile hydratase subunit beta
MNGVHDLGGMHGMGSIDPEPDEPIFHEPWERRVFAMFIGTFAGGHFNVDEFRHAIERMSPAEYLSSTYYEHWLHAMETLLVEKGALSREEFEKRVQKLQKEAS